MISDSGVCVHVVSSCLKLLSAMQSETWSDIDTSTKDVKALCEFTLYFDLLSFIYQCCAQPAVIYDSFQHQISNKNLWPG